MSEGSNPVAVIRIVGCAPAIILTLMESSRSTIAKTQYIHRGRVGDFLSICLSNGIIIGGTTIEVIDLPAYSIVPVGACVDLV